MIRYYATRCEGGWNDQLVWIDPTTGHWFRGPLHGPHDQGPLDAPDLRSRLEQEAAGRPFLFDECRYTPGHRHLRVNRGERIPVESLQPDEGVARRGCLSAVRPLIRELRDLFHVVEPVQANRAAFGQAFREILILACTEVEAAWVGVLRANGVAPKKPTTRHYVRLLPVMRLGERRAQLRLFPEYGPIEPFRGWDPASPTQTLPWYHAYNRTKHDRESHLSEATLEHAIAAVTAVVLMGRAQFGRENFAASDAGYDELFAVHADPTFLPEEQFHIGPKGPFEWVPVPFGPAGAQP